MTDEWPEGMVAVCKSRARSSGESTFHTSRCESFPSEPNWWREEICEAWDNFSECKLCSENYEERWSEGRVALAKSKNRRNIAKYHTEECYHFPDDPTWYRMETIENWGGFEECKICAGTQAGQKTSDEWSKYSLGRINSGDPVDIDDA